MVEHCINEEWLNTVTKMVEFTIAKSQNDWVIHQRGMIEHCSN
jgi:hypothetical protein